MLFSIHLGRLAGASVTVLLTTLEDAVWLVPLILETTRCVGVAHAAIFVATFTLLAFSLGLFTALVLKQAQVENLQKEDFLLAMAGSLLCWVIAAILYYNEWRKRRKYQNERDERLRQSDAEAAAMFQPADSSRQIVHSGAPLESTPAYGSVVDSSFEPLIEDYNGNNSEHGSDEASSRREKGLQIWLVIALTIVGAIDEVCYFPALVVGKVFSVAELTLGTLLASLAILMIVCVALAPCKPVLEFLDRIPLYAIVVLFAIIMTVDALWHWDEE